MLLRSVNYKDYSTVTNPSPSGYFDFIEDEEIRAFAETLVQSHFNTPEEKAFFAEKIKVIRVKPGSFLLKEGQIARISYYLFKGCVREFIIRDGEEKTSEFYTVGDILSEDLSRQNNLPTNFYWECVTECIVSVYPLEVEREMYKLFPRLETFCRIETERRFTEYRYSSNIFLNSTPEERYANMLKNKPELLQLVPQYHIASYLGVKPESLSRIRRRLRTA